MDIKNVEKKENGILSFQAEIDSAAFEAAVNKAYLKAKKDIYVPGFRKGKAPRMVIEGMYGASVFYEDAVEALAPEAYMTGKEQTGERTVGAPSIRNFNVAEDKTLTIDFEVALYPEVTLGQYKGLEAYRPAVEVSEEEVAKELESVQKRNARIVTVERAAANGDTANIDFDGYKDGVPFDGGKGEGYDLVLGSGSFVPGFEEQVVGMSAGEEKDIDITFPENYHADLAGAAVVFKVKVNEVKESQLPELDDEFAKDVSEFDTLDEYKASLKADLEKRKSDAAERDFREAVMEKAVKNMTVTVPEAMVDEQVNLVLEDYARNCAMQGMSLEQYLGMMGVDEATFRQIIRPSALNQVKTEILLEKVAETEGVEISEEDVENEYKSAAETYSMELEQIKANVSAEIVSKDLKMKKATDIIFEAAVATDKPEEEEAPQQTEEKTEEKAEDAE
ncbi:MAG: trigger factor [Oscillospiraceae bacterium]